jgi:hypothetical protein
MAEDQMLHRVQGALMALLAHSDGLKYAGVAFSKDFGKSDRLKGAAFIRGVGFGQAALFQPKTRQRNVFLFPWRIVRRS